MIILSLTTRKFEFRSWQTHYRGELLIHAGKSIYKEAMKRLEKYLPENIPLGKIIGKVNLTNCIKTSPEFFQDIQKENKDIYSKSIFKEEYAWQVELIEKFENPIEVNGHLRLWDYDV